MLQEEEETEDTTINEPSEHLEGSINQNIYDYTGNIPYDVDYYRRVPEDDTFKECFVPGVTSSVCMPKELLANRTVFCNDVNYDYVCVPVNHFLWPFWDVEEKDF